MLQLRHLVKGYIQMKKDKMSEIIRTFVLSIMWVFIMLVKFMDGDELEYSARSAISSTLEILGLHYNLN